MTEEKEPERKGKDWTLPCVLIAWLFLMPLAVHMLVDAPLAGWLIVILVGLGCAVVGAVDGYRFRASLTLPLLVALVFWATVALYYNEGTWWYVPIFGLLTWFAAKIGEKRPGSRRAREGF